jgi:hypothetical protein
MDGLLPTAHDELIPRIAQLALVPRVGREGGRRTRQTASGA